MSFDTFISILVSDLIGIGITLVVVIVQTKRNREGKRQIRIFRGLIAALVAIAVIVTGIYAISSRRQREVEFDKQMNEAYFDLENQDFLAAAEHYNQACLISYNADSLLEATYSKAMCYFLYGTINSQPDYYQNASKIYKGIIENEKYMDSEFYADAIIDMSQIYYALGYEWNEPEWLELIAWLENQAVSKSVEEITTVDELSLRLKAVYALGVYYEYATYSSLDNLMDAELSAKALKYYEEFAYLYELNAAIKGESAVPSFYTSNVLRIADFLLVYAISSPDPVGYINKAIELCSIEIENLNAKGVKVAEYVELKKNVGKGLIFLGYILEDQEANYRVEAYKTLSPLLSIQDESAQFPLMNLGYYLIRTNLCSDAEVDRIIDVYEYNISQLSFETNAYGRIDVLISACTSCRWIVENYEHYNRALGNGVLFSQELMSQAYDFLTEDQREEVEEFHRFFGDMAEKNTVASGDDPNTPSDMPEKDTPGAAPEIQVPSGYQIMVSASRVELYQEFTITVTPNESDFTNIVIHAKDPLGEVWTFSLGTSVSKKLYVDRADLIGTWTIYADVSNAQGIYSGEEQGPYASLIVESGLIGGLLGIQSYDRDKSCMNIYISRIERLSFCAS